MENQESEREARRLANFLGLTFRADKDPNEVGKLRDFLQENPDLITSNVDLADRIRHNLIDRIVTGKGSQYVLGLEVEEMQKSLLNEEPTAIESLVLEAVVLCWLRVQYAES